MPISPSVHATHEPTLLLMNVRRLEILRPLITTENRGETINCGFVSRCIDMHCFRIVHNIMN